MMLTVSLSPGAINESWGKNANIKNAVGEFHVDLYTLPDSLVKMLWDFIQTTMGKAY